MGFINKQTLSKVVYVVPIIFILLSIYVLLDNEKKEVKLDDVIVKENVSNKKGFAIMLQDEAGSDSYTASESTSFPTEGYTFNSEKSGCMDSSGYKIDDALNYDSTNKQVMVSVKGEAYCYVYFDIVPPSVNWVYYGWGTQSQDIDIARGEHLIALRYGGNKYETCGLINNKMVCIDSDTLNDDIESQCNEASGNYSYDSRSSSFSCSDSLVECTVISDNSTNKRAYCEEQSTLKICLVSSSIDEYWSGSIECF